MRSPWLTSDGVEAVTVEDVAESRCCRCAMEVVALQLPAKDEGDHSVLATPMASRHATEAAASMAPWRAEQ